MMKKQFTLIVTTFSFVMMLAAFSWVSAAPTPVGDLPPRPTEIPTEEPVVPQTDNFTGGLIVLTAPVTQTVPADYWVVVEWKDMEGNWNVVSGWQGEFDGDGQVTWWVSPDNFGEDDFRWVVYETSAMEDAVFTSETFSLPDKNGVTAITLADLD